jgi:hypothetical protein
MGNEVEAPAVNAFAITFNAGLTGSVLPPGWV